MIPYHADYPRASCRSDQAPSPRRFAGDVAGRGFELVVLPPYPG